MKWLIVLFILPFNLNNYNFAKPIECNLDEITIYNEKATIMNVYNYLLEKNLDSVKATRFTAICLIESGLSDKAVIYKNNNLCSLRGYGKLYIGKGKGQYYIYNHWKDCLDDLIDNYLVTCKKNKRKDWWNKEHFKIPLIKSIKRVQDEIKNQRIN